MTNTDELSTMGIVLVILSIGFLLWGGATIITIHFISISTFGWGGRIADGGQTLMNDYMLGWGLVLLALALVVVGSRLKNKVDL